MEARLENGDYLPDGRGGLEQAEEEILQRELGSRLYLLGTLAPAARSLAAERYVTEALAAEALTVEAVRLGEDGSLTVTLRSGERSYRVETTVG